MNEREIFLSVLEIENVSERRAHLLGVCAGDCELLSRVESLLALHESGSQFLCVPVVEQMGCRIDSGGAETTVWERSSTPDDETKVENAINAPDTMIEDDDSEELSLGYLQHSTKPGSIGRLAHYEILEVLGRGAYGTVLKGFDEKLQRVVAIKVLATAMAATSPARKRFLREARASAAIRHENVVNIYAVDETPIPYLVMEYIPGQTLQQRLDEKGPLDVAEVLRLGKQIASGLAAAHSKGLIHRDIKPGNILLEAGIPERVKITDFGLARAADDASMTQSGLIAGTPMYMAPEQAHGYELDQRADLFSLGSVLYQMVSGRPPFRAPTTLAVLKRVTEDTPRPIQGIIPETPTWLCDIISKLHAKNPNDRFQSAEEVADLLAHCQADLQQHGAKHIMVGVTPAPQPQRRLGRLIAVALLLTGMAGLSLAEAKGVTNLHGAVIRLFSPEGTLVVEVDDPDVSISIDGEDVVIKGAGAQEIRLKSGSHTLLARKNGKLVRQELVTVEKNGRVAVRVSQESLPTAPNPPSQQGSSERATVEQADQAPTDVEAWERAIAILSAANQVKFVSARLQELNTNFDGKIESVIHEGVVTGLSFSADHVSDISPVRALSNLKHLTCRGSGSRTGKLIDLSPLNGMPLEELGIGLTLVADLTPLKGMPLRKLNIHGTSVADLTPLHGLPLEEFQCAGTQVVDLSPLKGMKLTSANFLGTAVTDLIPLQGMPLKFLATGRRVTDLTPLRGMPLQGLDCFLADQLSDISPLKGMSLKYLNVTGSKVTDLTPLNGMPLTFLVIEKTKVTDLTPLAESPLEHIKFSSGDVENVAAILRAIPTLKAINDKPAAQFLKDIDEHAEKQ